MVEGLDTYQLLGVLIQEGLPIVCWYHNCALWCPCELSGVHIGRGVDDIGEVSQSTDLCVFVSVYKCLVSIAVLKQLLLFYLFFRSPKHQSGENLV